MGCQDISHHLVPADGIHYDLRMDVLYILAFGPFKRRRFRKRFVIHLAYKRPWKALFAWKRNAYRRNNSMPKSVCVKVTGRAKRS